MNSREGEKLIRRDVRERERERNKILFSYFPVYSSAKNKLFIISIRSAFGKNTGRNRRAALLRAVRKIRLCCEQTVLREARCFEKRSKYCRKYVYGDLCDPASAGEPRVIEHRIICDTRYLTTCAYCAAHIKNTGTERTFFSYSSKVHIALKCDIYSICVYLFLQTSVIERIIVIRGGAICAIRYRGSGSTGALKSASVTRNVPRRFAPVEIYIRQLDCRSTLISSSST